MNSQCAFDTLRDRSRAVRDRVERSYIVRNTRTGFGWSLIVFCIVVVALVAALTVVIAFLANVL